MNQRSQTGNPYTAPQADAAVSKVIAKDTSDQTLGEIAKRVFLDWEKMRIAYIGILIAFTLIVGWSEIGNPVFWIVSVVGAIIANLCYFLGPIVETYVSWLGFRTIALRWTTFAMGTLFTMGGALISIFTLPNHI